MIDDPAVNLLHRKPFTCVSEWAQFQANLGQISSAHANRGKLFTLLTFLHSWWPLLNLDLELGYVLLIRRLKQNNFFPRLSEFKNPPPPPPQKKKRKKKNKQTNKIKKLLVFVKGAVENCSVIILIYLFHVREIGGSVSVHFCQWH